MYAIRIVIVVVVLNVASWLNMASWLNVASWLHEPQTTRVFDEPYRLLETVKTRRHSDHYTVRMKLP